MSMSPLTANLFLWFFLGLALFAASLWVEREGLVRWISNGRRLPWQSACSLTGMAALGSLVILRGITMLTVSGRPQLLVVLAHWLLGVAVLIVAGRWMHSS